LGAVNMQLSISEKEYSFHIFSSPGHVTKLM
jgi:hypothetical protein